MNAFIGFLSFLLKTRTLSCDKWLRKRVSVLGKFNFFLKWLVKKGFVKIHRFKSSDNKAAYMYIITPQGKEQKVKTTVKFLKRKMDEYEKIKQEIEVLEKEVEAEKIFNKR